MRIYLIRQYSVQAAVVLLSSMLLASCGTGEDKAKVAQEKEAVAALTVQKKAFEENRYLNPDEVNAVTQSYDKIAATSSPEEAKKIRAMSEAIKTYRANIEEFRSMGGAKVETLKSQEDVDNRLKRINKLIEQSDKVKETCAALKQGPSTIATLDLEHQMLEKIRGQLEFYRAHYGQWQTQKNGNVLFTISPAEMTKFNKLAADIKSLGVQQMNIMKQNTEERLNKLNKTQ